MHKSSRAARGVAGTRLTPVPVVLTSSPEGGVTREGSARSLVEQIEFAVTEALCDLPAPIAALVVMAATLTIPLLWVVALSAIVEAVR